jgi:hypothetical protein
MKRLTLGLFSALVLFLSPATAAATPFSAVFTWQNADPDSIFTLEFLAPGGFPGDLTEFSAEVTVSPQFTFDVGVDPFCGQAQRVGGSTFAFCNGVLEALSQDTFFVGALPESSVLTLLFTDGSTPVEISSRLTGPDSALIEYAPSGNEVPEPGGGLALLPMGLLAISSCHRRLRRRD